MDINQLRYFLATAETLNYTKAAQKLFLSRQALRQSLTLVEKELGTQLFVNKRNKLSLTPQGEYMKHSAKKIVESFDDMLGAMKLFSEGKLGFTIALSVSLFPFLLPEADDIIKKFQKKYPQIDITVKGLSNDEVIAAIEAGTVDCGGIIRMPQRQDGMGWYELDAYDMIVSYGDKYQAWEGRTVTLEDVSPFPCISLGKLESALLPLYEECKKRNIVLNYEVVPDTIDAFYRIAHAGAVGLDVEKELPAGMEKKYCSRLEDFSWEVGLIYKENSYKKEVVEMFCKFVQEEYKRMHL